MSWSLGLKHGDLFLDRGGYATTTGPNKLVQDLRCALLEERGHDPHHPEFGSLIDGGVDEYGHYVSTLIGDDDWDFVAMRVDGEIRRISALHQQAQIERSKRDRGTYGQSTLIPDELLLEVKSVTMQQAQDSLMVSVVLQTGDSREIAINVPITNQVPI